MAQSSNTTDYLRISPSRALCSICVPLILVNVALLFTTALTNWLYSQYAGQTYFTVTGYIGVVTTVYVNIVGSAYIAGWVKISNIFSSQDKKRITNALQSALLATGLVACGFSVLLILLAGPVLRVLSVPVQIYADARLYFCLYFLFYLPAALAAFFLTTVNGIGSAKRIFWINIMVIATNFLCAWLLMAAFQLKFVGAALCGALGAVLQLAVYLLQFRRDGLLKSASFRPDWALIGSILRYSIPIALQNLLCTLGYLLVSLQTNRLLEPEYITVLNLSLPLTGVMSAVGSAILAFCPPNYWAGNSQRLQNFLKVSIFCSILYGLLCFFIYALLGTWYYGRLFTDGQIVTMGGQYWFWQGAGYLFLALIYPIRYFFDSVGKSQLSLLSGVGELVGNTISAFWLIPQWGNIGRSVAYPLGWMIACLLLIVAYLRNRREIYSSCEKLTGQRNMHGDS